jgi:hypothetical protein
MDKKTYTKLSATNNWKQIRSSGIKTVYNGRKPKLKSGTCYVEVNGKMLPLMKTKRIKLFDEF